MKNNILFLLSLFISIFSFAQNPVRGKVIDKNTGEPIEFTSITAGTKSKTVITDNNGNFNMLIQDKHTILTVSVIGYISRSVEIKINEPLIIELDRGQVDLKDVKINSQANSTSFHTISSIDLNLRPVNSAQDLMRLVPGLFLGQHHGGGIAEHIFFRGFDADHGTDVNVSVDGMPVNLVSHAHGQGFSDLHFLIPELVRNYEFGKGSYYADRGDFTTAGYVTFNTFDALEKSMVKAEGGQFSTGRVMAMIDLLSNKAKQKGENAYLAGEIVYTDGPFDWKQHFNRVNLFGKYNIRVSPKNRFSVTLSTFSSGWRSSGEIPGRAVDEGLTDRFGYIDSLQGGHTSRTNLLFKLSTGINNKLFLENQLYYSRYFFNHHYDDTYFAEDSINGDQLRQRETRDLFGYNGKLVHHTYFNNGADLGSAIGIGWQFNKIYNSELSHTIDKNTVLEYIQLGDVNEMIFNGYLDEDFKTGRWLINAGLRLDYLHFDYKDKLNSPEPARARLISSPKINIEYTYSNSIQFYLKTGKGFHSNDAKVVISNQGKEILPESYGTDIGINCKPVPHLFINAAVWYLYLQQEFVYDADEGTTEPGDKTKRQGIDFSARYQFNKWLFANVDLNVSKARNINAAKGRDYLPLSVPASGTGGVDFKFGNGINGGISCRSIKDRPANEDNSFVAKGYFITDLTAAYTKKKYEIGLEIQNLFNTKWREEQFVTTSRLRNETEPVDDISFTSGTPFFAKLKFAIFLR